ncbi:MAG: DUF1254 domain-containing protein [Erythrobacter sp.]|uniref:DUF1254 domain-containing protein n=1 Tax=Erythrobacter sp. TaxID=1042 RepID=UPI00329A1CFF
MKGWIGPIALALVAGIAAHWTTLALAPGVIMDAALANLAKRNIALHAFTNPQRITPQSQAVVRSSPDLFYALCRYDFGELEGSLKVTMSEWPGYQSLSFFDASTNNYATIRGEGRTRTKMLLPPEMVGSQKEGEIISPTAHGVILIRRLAPTQELFDQALEASKADGCEYFGAPNADPTD